MPITYSTALKNARENAVVTCLDDGTGPAVLEIVTSGGTVLASFTLAKPSGTVANGVLTFSGFPLTVTVVANGTAASARLKDSTGNIEIDGISVGTTGTNIVLNTVTLVQNQTLTLNGATISHA